MPVTVVPATALAGKATVVLTSARVTATVDVPVLLPGVGSVVPVGGVTLATLVNVPLALDATLTWKVTVARAPLAKVVLPLMAVPAPLAVADTLPLVTILLIVPKPTGRLSVQLAPTTALGPALPITIV